MSTILQTEFPGAQLTQTQVAHQVVCWGSAGAGKSSLAVNLSCELADLGKNVLLVDADSYHPSLAALLGITDPGPGITAVLRLVRSGRFTLEELHRLGHEIQLGKSSFWLLTGMNSLARWAELDCESLSQLPQLVANEFQFIVWDVASFLEKGVFGSQLAAERNLASNCLLASADTLLGIFLADPVGINRFLFDCRDVGRDFIAIGNRIRSSVLGRNPERQVKDLVYELARIPVAHAIPEDSGFDELLRSLRPLALQAKGSKAREAIRQIAQELVQG